MAPARLRAVVHPPVDAEMDAPTGGDTGAVRLVCGDLGAPLEEALSARGCWPRARPYRGAAQGVGDTTRSTGKMRAYFEA